MNDYLWDRTGPADPEIEMLERALAPLRHLQSWSPPVARPALRGRIPAGIAASVVFALLVWRLFQPSPGQPTPWTVVNAGGRAGVRSGQAVVVPAGSQLRLENEDFGQIDLAPGSRLVLVHSGENRQQMSLQQGGLHALIWAPPGQFVVETPSARAIDLGCEYDLTVDKDGHGFLSVKTGWVAFEHRGRESFIPAGAVCRTSREQGPGVPFYQDGSPSFRKALETYESTGEVSALEETLRQARAKDTLSLWHLLTRVSDAERPRVFRRFSALVALPAGVTEAKILARNTHALDLCWNALHLDDAGWWREWKRNWSVERRR